MKATAAPAVPDTAILDLFDKLRDELKNELIDRDVEIHGSLVALVSQLHMLQLGGPGIAKSMLFDRLMARISGLRYGKFPMFRLMTSDDVFGPVDVRAYAEEGRWRRILTGYLAAVDVANLEEIFKAGPATLGLLLPALNERVIRNDGQIVPIPLRVVFCSSNELPKDEVVAPLYDRIPLRYEVQPLQDKALVQQMLELDVCDLADVTPILTGDQIAEAHAAAHRLPFADDVTEKLTEVYFALAEKGIRPTPRRLAWTREALRAEAWLDGADRVAAEHMSIAAHTLWDLPAQASDVSATVLEVANPQEKAILNLLEGVGQIRALLPSAINCAEEEERQARGMEIYHKIRDAGGVLETIIAAGGSGRRHRELLDSCRASVHDVVVQMITKVMRLPIEEVADLGLPDLGTGAP